MKISEHGVSFVRVYNTDDGESHLEEFEYFLAPAAHGLIAENIAADNVNLRVWHDNPAAPRFHAAPRRQLVIHLSGAAEIEASDGSKRTLGVGSILLTDDTEGKGHCMTSTELPRMALFVPLRATANEKAGEQP